MKLNTFKALWVVEAPAGQFSRQVVLRNIDDLPDDDVLVRVKYSSLNYKDALSAIGNKGVTKIYPHTPGIDAAGEVIESRNPELKAGDQVLVVTAGEMGTGKPGGFGQYVRVPAESVVGLPTGLTLKESMAYGTAGFTAALCILRLEQAGIQPEKGEILVTGATGGVGSIAIGILAGRGYQVVALTGKQNQDNFLHQLGAAKVLDRNEMNDTSGRPLLTGRWSGVVDTIGGNYLSTAIRSTRPGGVITACGNAASPDLPLTVYPFILRGVSLIGIDSLHISKRERELIWEKLGGEWKLPGLDHLTREVSLEDLSGEIDAILKGELVGRTIVNLG